MTMNPPQTTLSLSLFGDLQDQPGDFVPSVAFQGVHRVSKMTIPTGVRKEREPGVPTLGTIVQLPKPEAPPVEEQPVAPEEEDEETYLSEIEVDFPDEGEEAAGLDNIEYQYNGYGVVSDNEIEVPDSLLAEVRTTTHSHEEKLRSAIFDSASLLFAHDDAANFVEVAMRDGLGLELEMDDMVSDAFVPLSRLNVLTCIIESSNSLPDKVKNILLSRLSVKTADEMMSVMGKKKTSEAFAALHKQYAASVTKAGVAPDMEVPANTLGVRASRK